MTPDVNLCRASETEVVIRTPESKDNEVVIRGVRCRPVETIINGVKIIFWEPVFNSSETRSVFDVTPDSYPGSKEGEPGLFTLQIHPKYPGYSGRGGYYLNYDQTEGELVGKLGIREYTFDYSPRGEKLNAFGGVYTIYEGELVRLLEKNPDYINKSLEYTDEDPLCLIPFRRKRMGLESLANGGVIAVHKSTTTRTDFWTGSWSEYWRK